MEGISAPFLSKMRTEIPFRSPSVGLALLEAVRRLGGGADLVRIRKIAMEFHENVSPLQHGEIENLLTESGFETAVACPEKHSSGAKAGRTRVDSGSAGWHPTGRSASRSRTERRPS